jgi:lipoprotein-releasing system permease protein
LNISLFIAKRIQYTQEKSFSATVSRIGIAGIALGLGVMLISFAILGGFKKAIQQKIFSFGAHLQVKEFTTSRSFEEQPISSNITLYKESYQIPEIEHIQVFAHKAGLLKTETEVQGLVLKGVGKDFNELTFRPNMVEGKFVNFSGSAYSKDIVVSRKLARQLNLKLHDEVLIYFVQNPPRVRKLTISGIYETGMEEFDEQIALCDIALLQKLNNWNDSLVGGFEIFLKDFDDLDEGAKKVFDLMEYDMAVIKITDKYIQIFEWLALLNRNVAIFLGLILFVACFNMVAILLILIMERTHMIGILKAIGASDKQVQRIFLMSGLQLVLKGVLWGNVIGIGFCALQYYFQFIPLDAEAYYMATVPIDWDFPLIILLNVAVLTLVMLVLLIPSVIITRISPVKALRFD